MEQQVRGLERLAACGDADAKRALVRAWQRRNDASLAAGVAARARLQALVFAQEDRDGRSPKVTPAMVCDLLGLLCDWGREPEKIQPGPAPRNNRLQRLIEAPNRTRLSSDVSYVWGDLSHEGVFLLAVRIGDEVWAGGGINRRIGRPDPAATWRSLKPWNRGPVSTREARLRKWTKRLKTNKLVQTTVDALRLWSSLEQLPLRSSEWQALYAWARGVLGPEAVPQRVDRAPEYQGDRATPQQTGAIARLSEGIELEPFLLQHGGTRKPGDLFRRDAESLAAELRAVQDDLDPVGTSERQAARDAPATADELRGLEALRQQCKLSPAFMKRTIKQLYGIASSAELTRGTAKELRAKLRAIGEQKGLVYRKSSRKQRAFIDDLIDQIGFDEHEVVADLFPRLKIQRDRIGDLSVLEASALIEHLKELSYSL